MMLSANPITSAVRSMATSLFALAEQFDEAEEVWDPFLDDDDLAAPV
ncbi:MAG: hypothetical protein JWM89_3072 [Acidimicrobiales bacterium]|nr:hypothetical protein [Acidimicrobiales bacterium]